VSTTSRILLGFLVFLAVGLYAFDDKLSKRVEREYLEAAEESMVDVAQLLAARLEAESFDLAGLRREWDAARKREFSAKIYNVTKTTLDMNLYVTDDRGIVVFDSDGGRTEGQDFRSKRDVALTLAGQYGARSTHFDPKDADSSVMFVSAPIRRDGRIVGAVSISKAQRSLFGFRDETRLWIRSIGLIYFGAVAVGAYLVVTLFSRPIRRLTAYAHAVARGERVMPPRGSSGEAATLGRAFEEMRDALENRAYVENYVQTVTHEMKSPVAAIRGAAELLHEDMPPERREKFVVNIQAEARRLQNIIDRLLALSALESRKKLDHPAAIPLVDLAHAVCAQLQPTAEARGLRLDLTSEGQPEVLGESFLLESALHNLLQNAIDFSPEGGVIRIRVALDPTTQTAGITVEDEGPGIPDYALSRVFERFYSLQRPDTGRKSSGLGLCFVREAAALHGGSIHVENKPDTPGTRAVLRLPVSQRRSGSSMLMSPPL
jgi:two-component system sensor histidine kinase CreC